MPLKRGPNNTERYYDSSTGRYCKSPLFSHEFNLDKKRTFKEREQERIEALRQQAINSKDKNLFEIYTLLEKNRPGCVQHINTLVFDRNLRNVREIDIITNKAVYEIKSGKAKHKLKQFDAQKKLAKSRNKDYVVYSPGSSNYQIECLRKRGIRAYNNIKDVLQIEEKRKWKT